MTINNNIIKKGDFYYPTMDKIMPIYLFQDDRINEPSKITKYCKNKNVCLQAGGNIGAYPIWFSKIFNKVITFEPEPLNYECLLLNIKDYPNIISYNTALGNENTMVSLNISSDNSGGHSLGKYIKTGNIKMTKIDDLDLEELDLLHIDVEGREDLVLLGAIKTIEKYWPVICIEVGWGDVSQFLINLGYKMVEQIDVNAIFVKK